MGGVFGKQGMASGNNPFNQLNFMVTQMLAKLNIATLVQVIAVHPGAGLLVGFVDVQPLVNQVAGDASAVPHGTIFGVPYFRVQGGANAVICDPAEGDVGFALFADRDLSSVKATGAQANPGSGRRFDMADALYFGGWVTGTAPTSYVQVTQAAINIVNPSLINLQIGGAPIAEVTASLVTINAALKVNGTAEVTGDTKLDSTVEVAGLITGSGGVAISGGGSGGSTMNGNFTLTGAFSASGDVKSGSISLASHVHSGVQTGGGNTGGPM